MASQQRQERDGSVVVTASATLSELLRGENGKAPLRKGKWTTEEEDYASHLVSAFTRGLLRLPDGTTLRAFLADELHCDPMRITKKFTGGACLGKRVYHSGEALTTNRHVEQAQHDLDALGERFAGRLERARHRGNGGGSNFDFSRLQAPGVVSTPAMDSMAAKCAPPPRRQPSPTSAMPAPQKNSSEDSQQQARKRSVLAAAKPACIVRPQQYNAIKPVAPASKRSKLPSPAAYGARLGHHHQPEQQHHGYVGYGGSFMAPDAYVSSADGYYATVPGSFEYLPPQLPLVPWAPAVQAHHGDSGGYFIHSATSLALAPLPLASSRTASISPRPTSPLLEDQEAGELLCGFIDHVKRSSSQADLREFHATARRVSLEAQARHTARHHASACTKAKEDHSSSASATDVTSVASSSYSGCSSGGSGSELSDGGSLSDATTEESLGSARSAPSLAGGKRRRSGGGDGAAASTLKDVAAAVVGAETAAAAWQLGKRARVDSDVVIADSRSSFAFVEAEAA